MPILALIDLFTNWWESLNAARQLFYGIGLVAGIVAIALAVLAMVGMESHDALDAAGTGGFDHGGGGIFSIKPLTGFFLGFGWSGGIALDAGLSLGPAVAIAVFAGTALMGVIVLMFRTIHAMRSDGTMRIADALGAIGTIYITVPPGKTAGGQVTVNFSGRQETFAALSAAERAIPSGAKVRVVGIIDGQTVMVEAL